MDGRQTDTAIVQPDSLLELSTTAPDKTADILSCLHRPSSGAEFWPALRSAIKHIRDFIVAHPDRADAIANHLFLKACSLGVPMRGSTLSILLAMLACLVGCTKSNTPAELSTVQGSWKFDEIGYLESLRARHKAPEDLKKMVDLYGFAKKNGTPVMTDITISGSRITTATLSTGS